MYRFESMERELLVLCMLGMAIAGCASGGAGAAVDTDPPVDPAGVSESADLTETPEPPSGASSTEALLEQRITIWTPPGKPESLETEYVLDLIRAISEGSFGGSLIVDTSLSGTFHANVVDKPLSEVLDAICHQTLCSWEVTNTGALRIYSADESH